MSIAPVLREIGRGREGARDMTFEQAFEVFGKVLRGEVSGVELGAFCAAMRIKGETPQEMAGFLRASAAVQQRRGLGLRSAGMMPVVLPSYNGSRRLPLLTPLLALLLGRMGVPVLVHGMPTEDSRLHAFEVFDRLGYRLSEDTSPMTAGEVRLVHTQVLNPGLAELLEVRRLMGLRNSAHSLVKLMNPFEGRALVVGSYTHPEYAVSMRAVFEQTHSDAMLLRGTEGEPVVDPRRMVAIDAFAQGVCTRLQDPQAGSLASLPSLPDAAADATARWTEEVLQARLQSPASLQRQLELMIDWRSRLMAAPQDLEKEEPSCTR